MPRVSAFYGIVILMFVDEDRHRGRPHFHAEYAGAAASFDIETLETIAGRLPRRATRLVSSGPRSTSRSFGRIGDGPVPVNH